MLTLMSGSVSAIQLFAPPYVAHPPGLTQSRKNASCFSPSHSDGLGWMGLGLTFCLFINMRSKECQGRVAEVYAGSCSPSRSFPFFLSCPQQVKIAITYSALFTLAAVRTGRGHANILHPLGGSKTREVGMSGQG